jgi:hypothetical protein
MRKPDAQSLTQGHDRGVPAWPGLPEIRQNEDFAAAAITAPE